MGRACKGDIEVDSEVDIEVNIEVDSKLDISSVTVQSDDLSSVKVQSRPLSCNRMLKLILKLILTVKSWG